MTYINGLNPAAADWKSKWLNEMENWFKFSLQKSIFEDKETLKQNKMLFEDVPRYQDTSDGPSFVIQLTLCQSYAITDAKVTLKYTYTRGVIKK